MPALPQTNSSAHGTHRLPFIRDDFLPTVASVMELLAVRSKETYDHSGRVSHYAGLLARAAGLGEAEVEVIRRGALLHDVGKMHVAEEVLLKPGELTAEEFAAIQTHPDHGTRVIESLAVFEELLPVVRWHHERLDGTGYPDRLAGDRIPLAARIVAVADVFDALAEDRPYRAALPFERAVEIMHENAAGGGLDPELVRLFAGLIARL